MQVILDDYSQLNGRKTCSKPPTKHVIAGLIHYFDWDSRGRFVMMTGDTGNLVTLLHSRCACYHIMMCCAMTCDITLWFDWCDVNIMWCEYDVVLYGWHVTWSALMANSCAINMRTCPPLPTRGFHKQRLMQHRFIGCSTAPFQALVQHHFRVLVQNDNSTIKTKQQTVSWFFFSWAKGC